MQRPGRNITGRIGKGKSNYKILLIYFFVIFAFTGAGQEGLCQEALSSQKNALEEKIEPPVAELKKISKKLKELKDQKSELVQEINQAKNDETIQARKKKLQAYKDRIYSLERQQYSSNFLFSSIRQLNMFFPVNKVLLLFFLPTVFFTIIVRYIWKYKKHRLWIVDFNDYRLDFLQKILPETLVAKDGITRFLNIIMITGIVVSVILFFALSAQAQEASSDIPLWKIDEKSFDENIDDVSDLISAGDRERLIFMLRHPLGSKIPVRLVDSVRRNNGLVFQKFPEIRYGLRSLKTNSFEHIFTLGRLLYENDEADTAFEFWSRISTSKKILEKHPFSHPEKSQALLLNILKIAYLEKRDSDYTGLERMFLHYAKIQSKFELAHFLALHVNRKKSEKLFRQLVSNPSSLGESIVFTQKLSEKKEFQLALPFFEIIYEKIAKERKWGKVWGNFIGILVKNIVVINKEPSQPIEIMDQYVSLLQKALSLNDIRRSDIQNPWVFSAYQLMIQLGRTQFVLVKLDTLCNNKNFLFPKDYVRWLGLYLEANETAKYITFLEKAWKEIFYSRKDLGFLLGYCLQEKRYSQASEILTLMLSKYPEIKPQKADEELQRYLDMPLPAENEGLSMIGFSGMLHYKIKNKTECKLALEEAIEFTLTETLKDYGKSIRINFNEIYYLLTIYLELNELDRVNALLPIYEYLAGKNLGPIMADTKQRVASMKNEISRLQQNLTRLSLDEPLFKKTVAELESRIKQLQRHQSVNNFKMFVLGSLFVIFCIVTLICLIISLFYSLLRAWAFTMRIAQWKTGVFLLRFTESSAFCLCATVIWAPLGGLILLVSQLLMSLLYLTVHLCPVPRPEKIEFLSPADETSLIMHKEGI